MIFTNQIEKNEKDNCYYRKSYSPEVFESLSIEEKRYLIAFTVEEFSGDVYVAYSDELFEEIGILTEQDVLIINNSMLFESKKAYSLELYLFLYKVLMKRFVARKKNFIPIVEECYLNKRWRKKDYIYHAEEIIILHLLLDELLEMNEIFLIDDEDRKYFLAEIENVSNRLSKTQDTVETVHIENQQEQLGFSELNDVHIGRKR